MRRPFALTTTVTLAAAAFVIASAAMAGSTTEHGQATLRSTSKAIPSARQHVIRRLYGEENENVRREMNRLEARMTRSRTGFNADPNHIVPYDNHPYDPEVRQRRLEEASNGTSTGGTGNAGADNIFQPMRIHFATKALDDIRDSSNAAKIDWYKNEILPATAAFWSSTLSVVPVSGNLRITSGELDSFSYCGDAEFSEVPNEHKSDGVADTDLILYVSGSASERFCPDRTLAVAVPCNFDQFDRPTAGSINVCLSNIILNSDGTASPEVRQDYIDVSIHEVAHVLGHSSNSYRFFWDSESGQPRTERPFAEREVTCVDGVTRTLVLPGESTMEFSVDEQGFRYASIVTPKVKTVARNQFDCQTLTGAPLENQPTRSDSCVGDHWDERLFFPEALSPVISSTTNVLSSLTLALMEDSGWYLANYTNSKMSPWGLGAGCDFVNQPCLTMNDNGETIIPAQSRGYFCNKENNRGCSSELSHKLSCTVLDYNYYSPVVLPDAAYQYFNEPSKGGPRQADFCPVYSTTYDNLKEGQLDCTNPANTPSLNVYSEVFDARSQCIVSNVGEGLCYETACVQSDMTLRIRVLGQWITCNEDFETHSVTVGQGLIKATLTCPRLSNACPEMAGCSFNCAGRGVCNYSNTVNGTVRPKCECFDSSDTSAACSDSMIPNGGFLNDPNGLFNNIEENFFDPLIKVFVDHPDAWTTASWAWASGLIVIFLLLLLCICSSVLPQRPRKM